MEVPWVCYDQLTALLLLPPSINLSRWGGRCQTRGEKATSSAVGLRLGLPSVHLSQHKNLAQRLAENCSKTIPNDNTDRSINDQSKQSSQNISWIQTWENCMNRLPPQVGVPWNRLLINQWPTGKPDTSTCVHFSFGTWSRTLGGFPVSAFGLLHHSSQTGASIWHGHLWQTH